MQAGQRVAFQVSQAAVIGQPMMFIDGVPQAPPRSEWEEGVAPPEVPVAPVPEVVTYRQLTALLEEVRGLRADLERRSFGGRLRRFWNWLTGGWR